MKRTIICLVALIIFSTSAFAAGDSVLAKGYNESVDQKATTSLSPGPHQGTLPHFIPVIIDGPVKRLIPISIHLKDGPIITGEAQYNEKTDRYDIRTVSAFSSDAAGKIKEESVNGYVVDSSNALGFPAMTKGYWIKLSPTKNPEVTVFITRTDEIYVQKASGKAPVGTFKGTMLHWLPAGSGTVTSPSPVTIRLEDGALVLGDAVYNDKTNCHEIALHTISSLDKTGNQHQMHTKGYVVCKDNPNHSCPNDQGVYASVARLTVKPSKRDEVLVVLTPIE